MTESVFAERIVQNLLDTDFYKLTMMQAVLHNYPNAEVEWEFRCRNSEDLTPYLAEIRYQIERLAELEAVLGAALLAEVPGMGLWPVVGMLALSNLAAAPGIVAQSARMPEIARLAGIPLPAANAWSDVAMGISYVAGPATAVLLVETVVALTEAGTGAPTQAGALAAAPDRKSVV